MLTPWSCTSYIVFLSPPTAEILFRDPIPQSRLTTPEIEQTTFFLVVSRHYHAKVNVVSNNSGMLGTNCDEFNRIQQKHDWFWFGSKTESKGSMAQLHIWTTPSGSKIIVWSQQVSVSYFLEGLSSDEWTIACVIWYRPTSVVSRLLITDAFKNQVRAVGSCSGYPHGLVNPAARVRTIG